MSTKTDFVDIFGDRVDRVDISAAGCLFAQIFPTTSCRIANKQDYCRLLLAVTVEDDWESWILFMLRAVAETAAWTVAKIKAVRGLMAGTAEAMKARASKIYSRELIELMFVQPYCRIADVVEAGIARRQSASVYLRALAEAGLLEEQRVGREKIFINRALLTTLTAD